MPVDDDPDDTGPFSTPLPIEDRLWRHPSEVGGARPGTRTSAPPSRPWGVAVVAGLIGAAVASGVVAMTGGNDGRVIERRVVERVAVSPAVSTLPDEADLEALVGEVAPAVARLSVQTPDGPRVGSAIAFRTDGHLLTTAQIVADATAMEVSLADGRSISGTLLGRDPLTDIAVVKVDAAGLATIVLGHDEDLQVGSTVFAIGSPTDGEGGVTVTSGVVSALGRRMPMPGAEPLHGMIQTDAPVAAGSEGGALVDANGSLVGITTAVTVEGARGFGFATPVGVAHEVATDIIETGAARHVWLGIRGADLPAASARAMQLRGGVEVHAVVSPSPAQRVGIEPGDVITSLDGEEVSSMSALVLALRDRRPGDEVTLGYRRGSAERTARVTLDEREAGER